MTDDLLDHLPDGVAVVGRDRRVEVLNRTAEAMTGWPREEAVGRFYGDVLPLRDAAGFLVHERADPFDGTLRITRGSPERDFLLRRRDGDERWVAVRAAYEHGADGRVERIVVSLRDIGRRRRLDAARADLIATVSHEIRSPLTSVKGFTSTLLHRWERFNDEQKRNMLMMMNHDADRVTRLLSDLLDVSRLEAGRLELRRQEADLAQVAEHVAERLRMHAEARPIRVEFPADFPKVIADPGKIEQVLVNLVENAIKYADGPVLVSGDSEPGRVTLRVADSGPGMENHHVTHIFTKFYRRGHGERRSGTGLGLYICKGIVEAHGGRIEVEKSDASGTVFTVALPRTNG